MLGRIPRRILRTTYGFKNVFALNRRQKKTLMWLQIGRKKFMFKFLILNQDRILDKSVISLYPNAQ